MKEGGGASSRPKAQKVWELGDDDRVLRTGCGVPVCEGNNVTAIAGKPN